MKVVLGLVGLLALWSCGNDGAGTSTPEADGGRATVGGAGGTTSAGSTGLAGGQAMTGGSPNTGGASGNSSGDAGASAGTAPEGGVAGSTTAPDPDGDPVPVSPELTGLIPHSTKWMLVSLSSGLNAPDDIRLLDLETHQLTDANPDRVINIESALSPDGRTYFFSNGNGAALSGRIIHLEPNGFVPARIPKDYANLPGAFSVRSWSFDSRFAMVARGGSGIEVMDMWLERRLHSEAFSAIVAAFAPSGYHFFYDAALTDGYEPRYAKITQAGLSPVLKLPPDAANMVFDQSGAHLYYGLEPGLESARIFRVSLTDGQTLELPAAQAGERARSPGMLPVADGVLIRGSTPTAPVVVRRLFADPSKAPVTIAEGDVLHHSDDNNLLLVRHFAEKTLELVRVEPYARRPLPLTYVETNTTVWAGIVGDHAFYLAPDGLHLTSLSDEGELRDQMLSPAGEDIYVCASPYTYEPKQRLALLRSGQTKLELLDLRQEPPAEVGSYEPPAGSTVGCPKWGDADRALGLVVGGPDGSRKAHVMTWGDDGPQPALDTMTEVKSIYAVMYR